MPLKTKLGIYNVHRTLNHGDSKEVLRIEFKAHASQEYEDIKKTFSWMISTGDSYAVITKYELDMQYLEISQG